MNARRFDRLTTVLGNRLAAATGRRALLGGTMAMGAAALTGAVMPENAEAKNKKKKKCKGCCTENGSSCKKKSKKCKKKNCLKATFTIEANWTNEDTDHDTYFFVPNEAGNDDPSPFIYYSCTPEDSLCETDIYPFICVSQDATGPGNEVTTVRKLLNGTYEYWIELYDGSPAGDLTIVLKRNDGKKVRSWSSPANPGPDQVGWHVFDIDGAKGTIKSVNQKITDDLPDGAHDPNTDVCPYV